MEMHDKMVSAVLGKLYLIIICTNNVGKTFPQTAVETRGSSVDNPTSVLPEVTVGVNDPDTEALYSLLFCSNTFMTAKHSQRELVDPRLQHGAKLLLEVGGLFLSGVIKDPFQAPVGVQQPIRVCRVVIIVSLDQG